MKICIFGVGAIGGFIGTRLAEHDCNVTAIARGATADALLKHGWRLQSGDKPAVILRNHGLLAWGESVHRTFAILWLLNRACEIQLASTAMGPVIKISEDVQRKSTRDSLQFSDTFGAGRDVFDALVRMIDRSDPSYKQ